LKEKEKEKTETMKNQNRNNQKITIVILTLLGIFMFSSLTLATPTGPSDVNITSNETKGTTGAYMVNISGGYISKLNLTATVKNPRWKAFVGWIDGKFTLDDASGSTIYDWTLSSVGGEVYATRASATVSWETISCANASEITAEDTALNHTAEDNITSTFTADSNSGTFVVAGTTIAANDCSSTNTYVNNATQAIDFEEVILHDETDIVYATILEEDEVGYDGGTYDFQMLVPENGLETWSGATAYYLYVELN